MTAMPAKPAKDGAQPKFTKSTPLSGLDKPNMKVAFQGEEGAYSHLASLEIFPSCAPLACPSFDQAFQAVNENRADYAVIPIENSLGGRVSDVHHLLPETRLYIIAEHFLPIHHVLWALPGTSLESIQLVRSHEQALLQCRGNLHELGLATEATYDTAGAARDLAKSEDKTRAVLASPLAGRLYGLQALRTRMEDNLNNVTRFLVFSRQETRPPLGTAERVFTSLYFDVVSQPASLYKALGGFATNGVNLVRLESYISLQRPNRASFYVEIEGHPDEKSVDASLRELGFYCQFLKILGVYPINPWRQQQRPR